MKNIVLSVVVISALVVAGIGGTFAHFSDTEEAVDNYVQIGAMDLKVNGLNDPDVRAVIAVTDIQPGDSNDFTVTLVNTGQPQGDPCDVYMHIKNPVCENVNVHHTGEARPEPEIVSEDGGWLGQVYVNGLGAQGDTCNLTDFINVTVYYPWDAGTSTGPVVYTGNLSALVCNNIRLGALNKCEGDHLVNFRIVVPDISEDDLADLFDVVNYFAGVDNDGDGDIDEDPVDGIDNDGDGKVDEDPDTEQGHFLTGAPGSGVPFYWDHWPTNALMKDKVTFDILFSLVQL
jgi:predicted ribosomally synthesized peptide with SipW-like signal peptide